MKLSKYLLATLKEAPGDADTVSAKLMQRAGMIRKVASGIYEWLPLGLRTLKKVEQIVREEMNNVDGQEVWLPVVQPKELWEETGRWKIYGKELLRFKDRKETEFCLAPTAEEVITDLVRREVRSWRQLPIMLYQFGTKFRDEIRPRFGVMRAREFYMKDAYSFHVDEADAQAYYKRAFDAYTKVFERCDLKFRPVEAESGPIGGSYSHEFMVLADTGENEIASCPKCGYAANTERAELRTPDAAASTNHQPAAEVVHTPGKFTVDDVAHLLKLPRERFIKTLFYEAAGNPIIALVRGDHELNEFKLAHALKLEGLEKASEATYRKVAGCAPGYAGPQGLKERSIQHHIPLRIVADKAVAGIVNGVSGANQDDHHTINLNPGRDFTPDAYADLRMATAGDLCGKCGEHLEITRGIEVGHTFKLGTKYSTALGATYLDPNQKQQPIVMGCYGIGVSRVVAAAVEQGNDEHGIKWPRPIAPFEAVVVPTVLDQEVLRAAEDFYKQLLAAGVDAALDDRDERAGVKFKDADLIGYPLRFTFSPKTLAAGKIEFKPRGGEMKLVSAQEALELAKR
jgi:prolyl-tRNA synthetase